MGQQICLHCCLLKCVHERNVTRVRATVFHENILWQKHSKLFQNVFTSCLSLHLFFLSLWQEMNAVCVCSPIDLSWMNKFHPHMATTPIRENHCQGASTTHLHLEESERERELSRQPHREGRIHLELPGVSIGRTLTLFLAQNDGGKIESDFGWLNFQKSNEQMTHRGNLCVYLHSKGKLWFITIWGFVFMVPSVDIVRKPEQFRLWRSALIILKRQTKNRHTVQIIILPHSLQLDLASINKIHGRSYKNKT